MKKNKLNILPVVVACLAMTASLQAQTVNSCPNVTVGTLSVESNEDTAAIYSDCSMESPEADPGFHLAMYARTNSSVEADGLSDIEFTPAPVADAPYGRWNGKDFVVEDMGSSYVGTCADMSPEIQANALGGIDAVGGHVYCTRVTNTDGNSIWIRGTWDETAQTWRAPIVVTNQPGVGTPVETSRPAMPVPTLPLPALWILGALAGLIGIWQFRASA